MSKMLVGSIDLNKIDKTKIVTKDKNGKPFENGAKYVNVVLWINDEPNQFGNIASIQQSVSKEEREAGVKGNYIANLKDMQQQSEPQQSEPQTSSTDYDPDLGF